MRSHLKSWCHRFATIALIKEAKDVQKERKEKYDMCCEIRSDSALIGT